MSERDTKSNGSEFILTVEVDPQIQNTLPLRPLVSPPLPRLPSRAPAFPLPLPQEPPPLSQLLPSLSSLTFPSVWQVLSSLSTSTSTFPPSSKMLSPQKLKTIQLASALSPPRPSRRPLHLTPLVLLLSVALAILPECRGLVLTASYGQRLDIDCGPRSRIYIVNEG